MKHAPLTARENQIAPAVFHGSFKALASFMTMMIKTFDTS
jgi:hypothetical protein